MNPYTEHVKASIFVSSIIFLDQSMSALMPRTTKIGNLPNLSFIQQKPKPLGNEFKCAMDGLIGKGLRLEIQKGK